MSREIDEIGNIFTGHPLVVIGKVPSSFTNSIKLIESAFYFDVFQEVSKETIDIFNKEKELVKYVDVVFLGWVLGDLKSKFEHDVW